MKVPLYIIAELERRKREEERERLNEEARILRLPLPEMPHRPESEKS